jgi:hypothetical protein
MNNFYNQPHVFVVFRPGAGGNFISGLLDNLLRQNFNTVKLSVSGHAHYSNIVERKRAGQDFLSFGSGFQFADLEFSTREEKLQFYKNGIDNSDYLDQPYVTWTHAFENIPIYRSLFPNAQILGINEDTLKERLSALIMHVNKNHFSNDNQYPFPAEYQNKPKLFKELIIKDVFPRAYPGKIYQSGHLDLDSSLLYRHFLRFHRLEKYLNQDMAVKIPYEDNGSGEVKIAQFSVNRHYVSLCSTAVNFGDISTRSTDKIVKEFETVLKRQLSDQELQYVARSLDEYVKSQDSDIIADPKKYLDDIKEKADMIVSAF